MRQRLVLRARLDSYSGYGQLTSYLIKNLNAFGHDVNVWPVAVDHYYLPIQPDVSKHIVHRQQAEEWELLISPPWIAPSRNRFTAYFTMFETTRLPKTSFDCLKGAELLIVPNQTNAACFSAQGIDARIHVCPLGVDPALFRYSPMRDGLCVFGTAGNTVISGRSRKGLSDVIDAFSVAFPDEQDVRLMVKALPGKDAVTTCEDPRVQFDIRFLTDAELSEWYSSLTCFVSASRGEGWGLMQHQAMAVGRPVIAAPWAGLSELVTDVTGYPLDFKLAPAQGRFTDMGCWAEPDLWQMVDHMRRVYEDRNTAASKGMFACQRANVFTWEKSYRKLETVLTENGLI